MEKIVALSLCALLLALSLSEAFSFTRTTYDRFGNKTGTVKSIIPGLYTKYDLNGNKVGTYYVHRQNYNYNNRFRRQPSRGFQTYDWQGQNNVYKWYR